MFTIKQCISFLLVSASFIFNPDALGEVLYFHTNPAFQNLGIEGFSQIRKANPLFEKLMKQLEKNSTKTVHIYFIDQSLAGFMDIGTQRSGAAMSPQVTENIFKTLDPSRASNEAHRQFYQHIKDHEGDSMIFVALIASRYFPQYKLDPAMLVHETFHIYQDFVAPVDAQDAFAMKKREVEAYLFELALGFVTSKSDSLGLLKVKGTHDLLEHFKTKCLLTDQDKTNINQMLINFWKAVNSRKTYARIDKDASKHVTFKDIKTLVNFMHQP